MSIKEGFTKFVNLMTPGAGVLMLGRGHISHYSEDVLYSTLSICSTLIAIVLRDYDAAFLYHRWFSFLWWGFWYTNMSPSIKSLILRWPLRPVGLLSVTCTHSCLYAWECIGVRTKWKVGGGVGLNLQKSFCHPFKCPSYI